jgi:hypothetical protein
VFATSFPGADPAYEPGVSASLSFNGKDGVMQIVAMIWDNMVHARPVRAFERYTTREEGGLVLRLPCGSVFRDGDTSHGDEYEDGGGNITWEVPPDSRGRHLARQEVLIHLARGLARIACEYYETELAMRRVAMAVTGIIPGATVDIASDGMEIQHEDRWGRSFVLRAAVGDVGPTEGFSSVYSKPAWLVQRLALPDTGGGEEMTIVFPTGEVFGGVELEEDTVDGGQWLTRRFDWQPPANPWASMEAYAVAVTRHAAAHFLGN